MNAAVHTTRNRHEAAALARLLQLLADGVAFTEAVWTASERGMDLDTARLVDLHDTHTRTAAPVTTPDTSTSHTPGPWRHAHRAILTPAGHCVAEVFSGGADSLEEADANARLIAAAPALLAALRDLLAEAGEGMGTRPAARRARAVLAAAGGAA